MQRSQHTPSHPDDRRTRVTLAALTGLIAGATRAIIDALLRHLTTSC